MAIGQLNKKTVNKANEWLKRAAARFAVPTGYVSLNYQEDADLLLIRFSDGKSTHSKDDQENGVIYNYDAKDRLVSVEVLDLYGTFA